MTKTTEELVTEMYGYGGRQLQSIALHGSKKLTFRQQGVSPLEQIIGAGLWSWVCIFNLGAIVDDKDRAAIFGAYTGENLSALMTSEDWPRFSVWHQVKVDRYTADFVLRFQEGDEVFWIAIECDGHDFHERTKEQAEHDRARDRHFQAAGLYVLRFTGSEIWRSPGAVIDQVVDFLVKKAGL